MITDSTAFITAESKAPFSAPPTWSARAVDKMENFYAKHKVPLSTIPVDEPGIPIELRRRIPAPATAYGRETSCVQIAVRMIGGSLYRAVADGIMDGEKAVGVYNRLIIEFLRQRWAPNSPQFFNGGLWWAYGMKGSEADLYRVDPKTGTMTVSKNLYEFPQLAACFLLDLEDSLTGTDGLCDMLRTETNIFRSGSGSGANASKLRGAGEEVSNGGTSSGALSFLTVLDKNGGAIKSGGTTRRAAKMVLLDSDHPDLIAFIGLKVREEQKVAALSLGSQVLAEDDGLATENTLRQRMREMRSVLPQSLHLDHLPVDYTGEAYRSLDGQNANYSVRWKGDLTKLADDTLKLTARTTGKVIREVSFAEAWHNAAAATWACGDPGYHYERNVAAWHTTPGQGEIVTSNPCSEFLSHTWSACNLASVNWSSFLPQGGSLAEYDVAGYIDLCKDIETFLYATVFAAGYPHPKIAQSAFDFRHTGLGPTNVGTLLMRLGLPYDSEAAWAVAGALMSLMNAAAIATTAQYQPSEAYVGNALNRAATERVLRMHAAAAGVDDQYRGYVNEELGSPIIDHSMLPNLFIDALYASWRTVLSGGFPASAQHTVSAPTGTISLVMDCDTTGAEPAFAMKTSKQCVDGTTLVQTLAAADEALGMLGYSDAERESIGHDLLNETLPVSTLLKPEHREIFATATGAITLSPDGHLSMVAALQPHVSGGISKTLNLPNSSTIEDIEEVAGRAYLSGVKCIALYRDGSKLSQPLNAKHSKSCEHCGTKQEVVTTGTCALCLTCGRSLGGCA